MLLHAASPYRLGAAPTAGQSRREAGAYARQLGVLAPVLYPLRVGGHEPLTIDAPVVAYVVIVHRE